MNDPNTLLAALSALAVFLLVLCTWGMIVLAWSIRRQQHRREVEQRIGLITDDDAETSERQRVLRLWRDGEEATTAVAGATRLPLGTRFRRAFEELGLEMPLASVILAAGGILTLAAVLGYAVTGSVAAAISTVGAIAAALWIAAQQRRAKHARRFETQFIDALHLVARSLRAGHPLQGAFQLVAIEMDRPISTIFADLSQQQALGLSMEEALRQTAASHWSEDLKLFATSVAIQLRSGGNLADMMQRLAAVIQERLRLARRVKVLTTQSQFSKRVLLVLPVGMFALLSTLNPGYLNPMLTTDVGRIMLAFTIASLAVGSWVMNRLAQLRY